MKRRRAAWTGKPMKTGHVRFVARVGWVLLALWLFAAGLGPAWAENPPRFTVTVESAFLRSAPNVQAARTYSVFKGQVFFIIGRTADNTWVQLDLAGGGKGTWIWTPLGQVTGDLKQASLYTASAPAATAPIPAAATPVASGSASIQANANPVTFTVTIKSVFGRSEPNLTSARVISLFMGQKFTVLARTPDNIWVKVAAPE